MSKVLATQAWGPECDLQHLTWKARHAGMCLQYQCWKSRERRAWACWPAVQMNWWALGLMRDTVFKVKQWVTERPENTSGPPHTCMHMHTAHRHAHKNDKSIFYGGRSYSQIQVQSSVPKPQIGSALSQAFHWKQTSTQLSELAALVRLIMVVHLRPNEVLSTQRVLSPLRCNRSVTRLTVR